MAIDIRADGTVHVREVIAYDFGSTERHGISRDIPVRFRWEGTPEDPTSDESDGDFAGGESERDDSNRYDRVYKLRNIEVSAPAGTPDDLEVSDSGNNKHLRIGDPDETISGLHTYTIDYDVEGALNPFSDHDELYWNAIGTEWDVPTGRPSVTVTAPAAFQRVACFAGPFGSTLPCGSAFGAGTDRAEFSNGDLPPGSALTFVVGLPKGAVSRTGPILEERWSFNRAFERTATTVGLAAAILVAGVAFIARLVWRKGRDRRYTEGILGLPPDVSAPEPAAREPATPGTATPETAAASEPRPLFADEAGPVVYRPPDGLRPAQLGVLIDERAHALDVTATIVDLAVRGYLTIEELEKRFFWSKRDWKLTQTKEADDELLSYEKDLLTSLFEDGPEVNLSDLKNKFHRDLARIQEKLYEESVRQGWFSSRPDKIRSLYLVLGLVLTVVGVGAVILAAAKTHYGLVPIPLVVIGLVLAIAHRWMPARTPKGSAALAQALGFRRYIETAETERMQFAEEENIFARYLPYAIVFGATRKWAKAFEGLGDQATAQGMGWYHSTGGGFHAVAFSESMTDFADSTSGVIASTPSSSGSSGFSGGGGGGFSGGGGGGGGGGSW